MCGIAGIVRPDGQVAERDTLASMLSVLEHRGPDARGLMAEQSAALGHVRLSILDLAGGRQPMSNEDGTLWVTFNGEIFNHVELRRDLLQLGHRFATRSDTEVILHAYEEFGEQCVEQFNGQWAFALWDSRRRRLFLSRDRLGVRPLFWTKAGADFLFASEIKALLRHPGVTARLDRAALAQLFTLWAPLPGRTLFEGIEELPPGHSLILEDGRMDVRPYWQLTYQPTEPGHRLDTCAEELLSLLTDAVRLRLRADVPVGAYLSGGLDSSLTTALICRSTGAWLRTFSVAFDDPQLDESAYQQEVVRYLRTEHAALACSTAAIGSVFPAVVWHAEKPMLRTAPAPLYLLARRVRELGCKVVVTGEGADEILGGYDLFKEDKVRRFWARQPDSRWRPLLLQRLYPYLPGLHSQPPAYLRAFFQVRAAETADPLLSHLPRWDLTARLHAFFSDDVRASLQGYDPRAEIRQQLPEDYARWPALCRAQYLETHYLLPGYILSTQGDRMAMAHGVEGRFPFLDHRVVEFAARLPTRYKLCGLEEKAILKRLARGHVPASICNRPKQPYRAPEAVSFFGTPEAPLHLDYVTELLDPERLRQDGVFHPAAVTRLVEKARAGKVIGVKDNMALVGILSTQLWLEQFVRRSPRHL